MKAPRKAVPVQQSSGNVFADLGLSNPGVRLVRAELAHRISQAIAARGWTQTKAAELMRLDQPKISALMHGNLKGFSAERLFRCLNDLGHEVQIAIRPVRRAGRRGNTLVLPAAR